MFLRGENLISRKRGFQCGDAADTMAGLQPQHLTDVSLQAVVYVSSASSSQPDQQMGDLVAEWSQWCRRDGVTGLLLCRDGSIAGFLEGEPEPVARVYAAMRDDVRHSQFIELLNHTTDAREFDAWSVAEQLDACRADESPETPGKALLRAMWGR